MAIPADASHGLLRNFAATCGFWVGPAGVDWLIFLGQRPG